VAQLGQARAWLGRLVGPSFLHAHGEGSPGGGLPLALYIYAWKNRGGKNS